MIKKPLLELPVTVTAVVLILVTKLVANPLVDTTVGVFVNAVG